MEAMSGQQEAATGINTTTTNTTNANLRESVQQSVEQYFSNLDGAPAGNLYELVLDEVEEPLLKSVLSYTKGNQSKAAILLGLSRGTLRKKMKKYGLLE
jgi:Fis family transcriptional regulator, factor for inversion stimulation protein